MKPEPNTIIPVMMVRPGAAELGASDALTPAARRGGDDVLLVGRAVNGDSDAYRVLVEKYQQRVFAVAFEILRSREDAEDVVQEAFVKAYSGLKTFRADASFYTWLCRVVYYGAIDAKRRRTRRGGVADEYEDEVHGVAHDDSELHSSIEGPEASFLREESAKEISNVLDGLSPEHRTVIMLREVDGLSYEEIAEIVKVSRGTVMSRLHYARKYLQKSLRQLIDFGGDVPEAVGPATGHRKELNIKPLPSVGTVSSPGGTSIKV